MCLIELLVCIQYMRIYFSLFIHSLIRFTPLPGFL